MSMQQLLKWNLSLLVCIFLSACSGSESNSSKTSKDLETPDGHHIVEGNTGTSVLSLYFISPVNGTLTYQSFNISAAEKSDYEAIKGSIQAVKGKEYAFDVTIYGDQEIEAQESFGIKFQDASGASVSTIIGNIDNDDFPLVSVSQPEVTELDVGTVSMMFTVSLSAPVVEDYTIALTSIMPSTLSNENKTKYPYVATPGQDYEEKTTELVFTENESEKEVEIVVLSENIIEEDETVLLQLQDAGGLNVLESTYAQGTIRSDETNKINGFQLSVKDSNRVKDIKEGTVEDASTTQWQAVNFIAQVEYPENIKQDQTLEITLLSKDQAVQAQLVDSDESKTYVDFLTGSEDLCLNKKASEDDACQRVIQHVLEPDTAEFPITLYVRKDGNREADEVYALSIKNDQNVHFLSLKGKVINDDSERLQLKYNGEYLDLADFTANRQTYVLYEPKTKEETELRELTLKLDTVVEGGFNVTYHVQSHIQKQPANGKDFIAQSDQILNFVNNVPSQQVTVPITLLSDDNYDGDKYIQVEFGNIDIDPLVIKIIDSNFPNVSLLKTDGDSIDKKEGTDYAPISESTDPVSGDHDYLEYWYTLKITGAQVARSDVDYKITLEGNGEQREANDHTCVSDGHSNEKAPATVTGNIENTDIIFGYGDPFVPIESGGLFRFKTGFSQTNWAVKVKNDKAIECLEMFTVAFTPQSQNGDIDNAGDTVAIKFGIEDKDKANITIAGWKTQETDVTNAQNFIITSDRDVATELDVNLLSSLNDNFACASSDLLASQDFSQRIQISPSDLSINFPVNIKGDQTVEPNEECRLEANGYASDLVTIIYQDENGVKQINESKAYSSGLIINNDILSVGIQMPDAAEPSDEFSTASIGTYSWDKNIAPNVGKIAITATLQPCDEDQDCVDEGDTTLGDPSNSPASTQEIVIHYGTETDILSASLETALPIDINGDAIIENTEVLKVAFSRTDGVAYMNTLSEPEKSMLITSEDTLGVYLEERINRNTCGSDHQEKICERIFDVKFDSKNSDNILADLKVGLKINTLMNTLNINGFSEEDEHKDAIISVKSKFSTGFSEAAINEDGEIVVDVINNLEEQLPSIKIEFLHDEVVEIDEALSLSLVKHTQSDFYIITTEVGLNRIEQTVDNNDFINLIITGSREIAEPASQMSPFTLTWSEDIDIASIDDHPALTYKIASACIGLMTLECLEEDLDYILEKDSSGSSLAESEIRLDSTNQSISMDYFQLTGTDNLVELPETIALTLQSDSPFIASIKQNNATNNTAGDDIDANLDADTGVSSLNWDLVVSSEETLTVVASSVSTAIDEKCDINDSACSQTKTVTSLAFEGSVATNGPTIILDVVNSCVVDATNNNKCALASTIADANPSEQDYSFRHANNQIILHKYKSPFISGIQNINLLVSDDNWVEEDEHITLGVEPTDSSSAYITQINGQNWRHTQAIVLNSDDTANVSLVRNTANSTCIFETDTIFTEDACVSAFDLTLTNPIAKEVINLNANLTRQNTTAANFNFKRNQSDVTYDATLKHTLVTTNSDRDIYESNSAFNVPIHINGQITQNGVFSTLKVAYESDNRVEIDETLNYQLDKKTSSALYSVTNGNSSYVINETIKNNDFIDLKVIGSNEQNEPVSSIKPYRLDWGSVLELPAENLPTVVFNVEACAGTEALECMDAVTDYTLDTSAKAVTLPLGVQTLEVDYLTVQAIDNLVELPEVLNLALSTDSPYIKTITNTNGTADNLADDKAITLADNRDSLSWALKINSQEKLKIRVDDQLTTLSEICGVDQGEHCSVKTLGRLIVDGTVAKNGPSISLNVANTCSPDVNNTNRCAIETSDSSNNDSEKDYVFTTGKGTHIVHTYGEDYAWNDKDIQVTVFNDDWVEVTENITLAYTATQGSSHISSLPDDQAITLASDDTTAVSIARNDTSSCVFSSGTQFKEEECNNKTSRYDLALTHSIAKEVATIDVALDLSNSTNTLLLKQNAVDTEGFDVGASVNAVFAVPDANKKLYLPVHTQNTITTKNTADAPNNFTSYATFSYRDDEDAEPKETLDLKLATNAGSLYTIAAGSAGMASETIIDNDSVNFWLTTASNQTATENDSNDADTNTKLTYTLHWDKTIPADIEKLQFDFKPLANKQTTATLDEDYTITENSDLITLINTNNGTIIEFDNDATVTSAGSVNIIIEIIGDQLVEVPETISAMLSISDTYTSELAAVGANNVAVDITIPNDDLVTVTLFSNPDSKEGDGSVLSLTQPFSYTLNKNIAADVPTIELFMDLTCNDMLENCIEYNGAVPLAESNDIVFSDSQYLTLHTGPEGASAGVYTQSIDPATSSAIIKSVPLSHATDDRVEAHETLTVNFTKVGGLIDTNPEGRSFIQGLKNGDDISDICTSGLGVDVPCEELDKSVVILNDDKIDLYITKDNASCKITDEDVEPPQACQYTIDWKVAFDMQDVSTATANAVTKDENLDTVITNTNTQTTTTINIADSISEFYGWNRWNVNAEIGLATQAKTNATNSKVNAQNKNSAAQTALTNADEALNAASTSEQEEAATKSQLAAQAASNVLAKAISTADSAISAANAALSALEVAKRAMYSNGDRDDLKSSATTATNAANNAITQANAAIQLADDAVLLANAALQSVVVPVIDDDAGEISLVLTHSGAATYSDTFKLDDSTVPPTVTTTIIDPKDYQVDLNDTVQTSKLILKEAGLSMAGLPRTLSITTADDNFMEPDETIDIDITGITSADNHEYISNSDVLAFNSTIAENDTANITVAAPIVSGSPVTLGAEGNTTDTTITYSVILPNYKIAINYPDIELTLSGGDLLTAEADDYSISDMFIHKQGITATLDNLTLDLIIHADNILEQDELVDLDLELTSNTATLAGLTAINYTINNDDKVIVNITTPSGNLISKEEGSGGGWENLQLTYTLSNPLVGSGQLLIASDYPSFNIVHTANGGTATEGNSGDYRLPSSLSINTGNSGINYGAFYTKNIRIKADSLVERDETFTVNFEHSLASTLADDVVLKVNAAEPAELNYTIRNNDYIEIDFRCGDSNTPCDGDLREDGSSSSVKPYIKHAYSTDGLNYPDDFRITFKSVSVNTDTATMGANQDYILESVTLPAQAPNLNYANSDLGSVITVRDDQAIEKQERFTLGLSDSYPSVLTSVIKTGFTRTAFNINNIDFLAVNLETVEPTNDITAYNLQLCKQDDEPIQGGEIKLTTTLLKVKDGLSVISDVASLTCADIDLTADTATCTESDLIPDNIATIEYTLSDSSTPLVSDIPLCSNDKLDVPLFTLKDNTSAQPNKWFNIEVTTDERCDTDVASGNCIDPTDVIVQNNKLTNVLDTGLTQCLKGKDKRWAVDCDQVENGSEAGTVDYRKQDAQQTDKTITSDLYPDLAYTFVNGTGQPVPEELAGEVCVQDNNTGFIWSGTVLDTGVNIRTYQDLSGEAEFENYDCNIINSGGKNWKLPNVQELMTVLDIENLKTARDFGIRFTDAAGDWIYNLDEVIFHAEGRNTPHSANYWTSDICGTNKYFVLNFLNGELICSDDITLTGLDEPKHSIMMLYK